MPQLRRHNRKDSIYNVGDHHIEPPIKVPTQRSKEEPGCPIEIRKRINISSDVSTIRLIAKAVNKNPSSRNIEKLKEAKAHLATSRQYLFEHLMECERCGTVTE